MSDKPAAEGVANQLDIREQLVRIDRSIAETRKFQAEVDKLSAEARKFGRESVLQALLAITGLVGGIVAAVTLYLRAAGRLP